MALDYFMTVATALVTSASVVVPFSVPAANWLRAYIGVPSA